MPSANPAIGADSRPVLFDSHAHLDGPRFAADLEAVIARAAAAGVQTMISVGCDLASSRTCIELARRHAAIHAAIGIHPHDAASLDAACLAELETLAQTPEVVAIGETGLDYYRNRCPHEQQHQAFRQQIALARRCGKPLIIHDRDAHEDVVRILREEEAQAIGGVLHCFSGDQAMAETCLALGFYLSFTGTLTYPANQAQRDLLRQLPLDRLLLETDCPYLAPQPWRGQRNEPAYVAETARLIAELRGLSLQDIGRITSLNGYRLFGVGQIDQAAKIAYPIRNALYLNITNRCSNRCVFCAKFRDFAVKGHQLKLDHEPDVAEILAAIGDPTRYEEVVFCGYGEPLLRLDTLVAVARQLKSQGVRIRVNTDGLANLVHGRNILPELEGLVDSLSVSLNASNARQYQQLCQSPFGENAFSAVTDFIRLAPQHVAEVVASAVTVPGVDCDACAALAAQLGVRFRKRLYNEVG